MKCAFLLLVAADAALLRRSEFRPPGGESHCGEGYDNLIAGTPTMEEWYLSATDCHNGVFAIEGGQCMGQDIIEPELQCWFAKMVTTKCEPLKPEGKRNEVKEVCYKNGGSTWRDAWRLFSAEQKEWFNQNYQQT